MVQDSGEDRYQRFAEQFEKLGEVTVRADMDARRLSHTGTPSKHQAALQWLAEKERERNEGVAAEKEEQRADRTLQRSQWLTNHRSEIVSIAIAGAALVASIAAVWYAHRQVDIAEDTARRQLRAYISIELAEPIQKAAFNQVRLRLVNNGQTPAYRLAYNVRIFPAVPNYVETVDGG